MRFPLSILFALAGVAGSCSPRPDPPIRPATALDVSDCEAAPDWTQCVNDRESELLARSAGVTRSGDSLVIKLEGASVVVLRDSVNEYGVGHHYLYSGFIPAIGSHLVELQLYEGGGFALVSRTGRITTLDGKPVLAPGGDRFVTASWDTEAGHDPNRIQIFRYDADSILLEWEMEPELWGPDQPRWENDSTLSIVRRPSLFHPDSASLRAPLILTRAGRRWVADSLRGTP